MLLPLSINQYSMFDSGLMRHFTVGFDIVSDNQHLLRPEITSGNQLFIKINAVFTESKVSRAENFGKIHRFVPIGNPPAPQSTA